MKSQAFEAGADDYLIKLLDPIELIARIRYHSRSFVTARTLDYAYRAFRTSQQQLLDSNLTLQRALSELKRLVNSDGLIDLANCRHFDELLQAELQSANEAQQRTAALETGIPATDRLRAGDGVDITYRGVRNLLTSTHPLLGMLKPLETKQPDHADKGEDEPTHADRRPSCAHTPQIVPQCSAYRPRDC